MSMRIDTFRADGTHSHVVYGNVTGQQVHENLVSALRSGAEEQRAKRFNESPIRTVVACHVNESPWF